jgi:peptidyl-prolyl cis-trans isomerase C
MKKECHTIYFQAIAAILLLTAGLAGCGSQPPVASDAWLVRVGSGTATVSQFNEALQIAMVAYSRDAIKEPAQFQGICKKVLAQITDELTIIERARELELEVTPEELAHAVADFKADYPGDAFEAMLLEYAVSASEWEKGLAKRMLLEKVIEHDLYTDIEISAEDVAAYYKAHFAKPKDQKLQNAEAETNREAINRRIVIQLRKKRHKNVSIHGWPHSRNGMPSM